MLGTILRRRAYLLLLAFGALGCAGAAQVTLVDGSCSTGFEDCMGTCSGRTESVECELSCRFKAKQCARLQGTGGKGWLSKSPRLGDYKALLIDLSGRRPLHSKAVELKFGGETRANPLSPDKSASGVGGYTILNPGAHLAATYVLPADLREAALILTHAPGGDGARCFITLTMGEKTIVGRYAPPRVAPGQLKEESWNLTPDLADFPVVDGKRVIKLFLYNNQIAGSLAPYHLGSIELHYRAMEAR
jgi:hypothetical protein